MIVAALMLAAAPATAIDAERAFAADAQRSGQWTAFRKWAAADATMFVPRPVKAQEWLKDRKDPTKSVDWWPIASFVSCDGGTTVNTGGWKRPDNSVGYFSTVWKRQGDNSWKWAVDGGDDLAAARPKPSEPRVQRAACGSKPTPAPEIDYRCAPLASETGEGRSSDGTLVYFWSTGCGGGSREFLAWLWNGSTWDEVVDDSVPLTRS